MLRGSLEEKKWKEAQIKENEIRTRQKKKVLNKGNMLCIT